MIAAAVSVTAYIAFFVISIRLAIVDAREHRLPNRLVALAGVIGVVAFTTGAVLTADPQPLWRAVACAAGTFLAYLALHLLARTQHGTGLGGGDVKLAGVLGLYLGYLGVDSTILGIAAGFVLGALFSLVLIAVRRANRHSHVAFGPWMLAGAWLVMLSSLPELVTSHYS